LFTWRISPQRSDPELSFWELLPCPYVHVAFTLPAQLASLALHNKQVIYDLLLRASADTFLEVARTPRHLGAEIGFSVLHT
jgi:hypothetical protein